MIKKLHRLGFDVVDGCQLKCIGCPNSTFSNNISFISLKDFRRCLENIDVEYVTHIRLFNYGEPLLHPNLVDLVTEIPKQKWWRKTSHLEVSTNGQYRDFTKVTDLFKTGELSRFVVSCDGNGTKEDYERMRPPAKWDVLLDFLKTVKDIRDKYSPNVKLMTRIICVINEEQERWNELLLSRGWTPEFRGWIYLPGIKPHPPITNRRCSFVKNAFSGMTFNVNSEGLVVPCCGHPRADILGDLKKDKYNDILKGKVYKEFDKRLKTDRVNHPVCGDCIF